MNSNIIKTSLRKERTRQRYLLSKVRVTSLCAAFVATCATLVCILDAPGGREILEGFKLLLPFAIAYFAIATATTVAVYTWGRGRISSLKLLQKELEDSAHKYVGKDCKVHRLSIQQVD